MTDERASAFSADQWEERYAASRQDWFFGREPSALGRLAAHFWRLCHGERPAHVLELGCGEGRDAVFLAQQGHRVSAVEIAPSGVAKAAELARERGVTLEALECADLRTCAPTGTHDLIFAGNSLSSLGADCLPFLRRLQEATPSDGLNAIRVATREAWGADERPNLYRFDRNELKCEYRGWRLLYYGEDMLYVPHLDRLASFADIIAQKT